MLLTNVQLIILPLMHYYLKRFTNQCSQEDKNLTFELNNAALIATCWSYVNWLLF